MIESEVRDWRGSRRRSGGSWSTSCSPTCPSTCCPTAARRCAAQEAAAAGAGQVFNQIRKGQVIVRKGDVIDAADARAIAQMRRRAAAPRAAAAARSARSSCSPWSRCRLARPAAASGWPTTARARLFGEALLLLLLSLLGAKFCFLVAGRSPASSRRSPLDLGAELRLRHPVRGAGPARRPPPRAQGRAVLAVLFSALLVSRLAVDGDPLWVVFYSLGRLARRDLRPRALPVPAAAGDGAGRAPGRADQRRPWCSCFALAGELPSAAGCSSASTCSAPSPAASWSRPWRASPCRSSRRCLGITTDIKLVELSEHQPAAPAPAGVRGARDLPALADGGEPGQGGVRGDRRRSHRSPTPPGSTTTSARSSGPTTSSRTSAPARTGTTSCSPSMSALILINHVKDGLELAREHGLPQVIRDAIEQHHGTRLIKYFYNRAHRADRTPTPARSPRRSTATPGPSRRTR